MAFKYNMGLLVLARSALVQAGGHACRGEPGPNLLSNPSWEDGLDPWKYDFPGPHEPTWCTDTDGSTDGKYELSITGCSAHGVVHQSVSKAPKGPLTYSFDWRASIPHSPEDCKVTCTVSLSAGSGPPLASEDKVFDAESPVAWHTLSGTYHPEGSGDGDVDFEINIKCDSDDEVDFTINIDNAVCHEADVCPPPPPKPDNDKPKGDWGNKKPDGSWDNDKPDGSWGNKKPDGSWGNDKPETTECIESAEPKKPWAPTSTEAPWGKKPNPNKPVPPTKGGDDDSWSHGPSGSDDDSWNKKPSGSDDDSWNKSPSKSAGGQWPKESGKPSKGDYTTVKTAGARSVTAAVSSVLVPVIVLLGLM
ncbi:hypothetical protein BX600DRAFT_435262 [Xylariales sp. PMI_506]|nr:hypothetical protein BX600DRAFT_435262 [Xylariales sp. PMI_506]